MAALHDVAVAAGGATESSRLADLVVERARLIAGGDAAVLRWFDSGTKSFQLLAASGVEPEPVPGIPLDWETAIGGAFKSGLPMIVNDYPTSGRATPWGLDQKIQAQVAVPLLVEARPVGTLAVLSFSGHAYVVDDARFLSLLAAIVAPALESARLSAEIQHQRELVSQIYDALRNIIVVYDRDGRPIHYNSAARSAWAHALDDPSGDRDHSYPTYRDDGTPMPPEERPFARVSRTGDAVRSLVVGYDVAAERRWAYVDAVPILNKGGGLESVLTSATDITALKAAEERLRNDAQRLRRLIAIQTTLSQGELTELQIERLVAEHAAVLTGAPGASLQMLDGDEVEVVAGSGFGSELIGTRLPASGNPLRGCVESLGPEATSDMLVDPRCNQEVARQTGIRSLVMAPIRYEDRVIGGLQLQSPHPGGFPEGTETILELLAGFTGAAITRARTSSALRQSELLFSGAFEASGIGMALTDLGGSVLKANPALCALIGRDEAELVGMSARSIVAEADLEHAIDVLAGLYLRSEPAVLSTDLRVMHKSGHEIWARLTASLIRVGGEPRQVLVHLVDVTEERKAAAILESERERLSVVIDAQQEIAVNEFDLDRLLRLLAEHAVRLTGADAAMVLLPEGDSLRRRASAGLLPIEADFKLPIEGSLAGTAFRKHQVQRASDALHDPRAHAPTARRGSFGSLIHAPLMTGENVIGVLSLASTKAAALDDIDARTVEMLAGFAAAAFERATTTRRLKASEQRTRAVMEHAPDPIIVFDASGSIVDFNPAASRAFVRTRAEMIGEHVIALLAPRHAAGLGRWLRDGKSAGSAEYAGQHFEALGRRSDGTEFPIEIAIANLAGDTQLAAGFLRDLTLRDSLRESRDRLASVVSAAPVILIACDVAGIVTLAEGRGFDVVGIKPEEAVGRDVRDLLSHQPDALERLNRALTGESMSGQLHLQSKDVYLEGAVAPILNSDGAITGITAVLTDVTDRARAEAARRESDAKSRLMAMMNHEVRTPLNSILGFARLLGDPRSGELDEKQRRFLANIQVAGDHLMTLINESLDMARLDAGRAGVHPTDVRVQPVLAQAADQVRPLADARGLTLAIESDDVVMRGDERHVLQILLNMLSNAIRHTQPGGSVTLSARRDGLTVAMAVADTGDGIAKEDLGRIFEEFYQAGNHAPGGIGLGLAISRRLAQMMGGSIEVESDLGRGSTFTLHVPAAKG